MRYHHLRSAVHRFLTEDGGQDLIEYALLTGVIGFAGAAMFDLIRTAIGNTYGTWESSTNDLWESPNPSGS
jgi:Flp pilus assembly pilin Flp